jgi:hypothetical protein
MTQEVNFIQGIIDDLLLRAQVVYKLTGAVHLFAKCGKASEKKRRRILKEKRKQYDNDMTKKPYPHRDTA